MNHTILHNTIQGTKWQSQQSSMRVLTPHNHVHSRALTFEILYPLNHISFFSLWTSCDSVIGDHPLKILVWIDNNYPKCWFWSIFLHFYQVLFLKIQKLTPKFARHHFFMYFHYFERRFAFKKTKCTVHVLNHI
jgi:hypothetical protein